MFLPYILVTTGVTPQWLILLPLLLSTVVKQGYRRTETSNACLYLQTFEGIGLKGSESESCIFYKHNKRKAYVSAYVDDVLILSKIRPEEEFKESPTTNLNKSIP